MMASIARLRGALAVGVFDAQHHPAAVLLGVKPVEQRRARPADMQKAGGRRSEAGDDLRHERKKILIRAGAPLSTGAAWGK